jgi:hypothetical protein
MVLVVPWRSAHADPTGVATPAADSPDVSLARQDFVRGADFANHSQWAEALSAFEHSEKLRPHAVTTFNIGACQRAMGNYTLARETLLKALADNDAAHGSQLPDMLVTEARGYVAEIDHLLSTIAVTLMPADTRIAVDGRPLAARAPTSAPAEGPPTLVAGVLDPGTGEAPSASTFRLILNPGTRVFTLSRKGFADQVVTRSCAPGASTELKLELDRLPALLHIASDPTHAVVSLDGIDVGVTPVDVTRPAGSYRVLIRAKGVVAYDTQVVAHAGEDLSLSPTLPKEKVTVTQKWWFWTAIGVAVAGAAAGTFAVVRSQEPAPAATPPTGGTLGWTVSPH